VFTFGESDAATNPLSLITNPRSSRDAVIPQPRGLISVAFGGPDKKTLFAVGIRDVQLMSIQMIAQGDKKRPK